MRTAVIVFPGSNCDRDLEVALQAATGRAPLRVWHTEPTLPDGLDLVGIPGGFSFGDYLRSGAIAARAPAMDAVRDFAGRGGHVLGICNGFQILTESGLLPGAFVRNAGLRFVCRDVHLRVETADSVFTRNYPPGAVLRVPVAHADGNFTLPESRSRELAEAGRVAFRYTDRAGTVAESANPNGSTDAIAGILSANRRILGMMPHPERLADPALGGTDGAPLFAGLADAPG